MKCTWTPWLYLSALQKRRVAARCWRPSRKDLFVSSHIYCIENESRTLDIHHINAVWWQPGTLRQFDAWEGSPLVPHIPVKCIRTLCFIFQINNFSVSDAAVSLTSEIKQFVLALLPLHLPFLSQNQLGFRWCLFKNDKLNVGRSNSGEKMCWYFTGAKIVAINLHLCAVKRATLTAEELQVFLTNWQKLSWN